MWRIWVEKLVGQIHSFIRIHYLATPITLSYLLIAGIVHSL